MPALKKKSIRFFYFWLFICDGLVSNVGVYFFNYPCSKGFSLLFYALAFNIFQSSPLNVKIGMINLHAIILSTQ